MYASNLSQAKTLAACVWTALSGEHGEGEAIHHYSLCVNEDPEKDRFHILEVMERTSICAYRVSADVSALDAYATGCPFCSSAAPSPCCEASHCSVTSSAKL